MSDFKEIMTSLDAFLIENNFDPNNRPKKLYKYRSFDQYTFDMIENNYVFLCVAEKLDDKSECVAKLDVSNIINGVSKSFLLHFINLLIDALKKLFNEEQREEIISISQRVIDSSNNEEEILANFKKQILLMAEKENIEMDNDILDFTFDYKDELILIIDSLKNARKELGVCSLSESVDDERLWSKYGDCHKGYCIEYDVENYEFYSFLLPVFYKNKKEKDIFLNLCLEFCESIYSNLLNQNFNQGHLIKMLLTKSLKWKYQKEWRLIGEANSKMQAPKIRKITIGKFTSKNNKEQMIEFCKKNNIVYSIEED